MRGEVRRGEERRREEKRGEERTGEETETDREELRERQSLLLRITFRPSTFILNSLSFFLASISTLCSFFLPSFLPSFFSSFRPNVRPSLIRQFVFSRRCFSRMRTRREINFSHECIHLERDGIKYTCMAAAVAYIFIQYITYVYIIY